MGLSDTKVKGKLTDGIYGDGGGSQLYLRVQGKARSWLFIYLDRDRRRRTMGLGGYPSVSLKVARVKAQGARELVGLGKDPIAAKRNAAVVPTFGVCAEEYVRGREAGWSPAVAQRYRAYMRTHLTDLADRMVTTVGTADVEQALRGWWGTPTGSYMRSFVARVLDYARVKYGLEDRPNPARYKGHLEHILTVGGQTRQGGQSPGDRRNIGHHAAMDWRQVPAFVCELDEQDTIVSRALMLTILGGFRQLEVRELRWNQVRMPETGGTCTEVREMRWREVKMGSENAVSSNVGAAQHIGSENVKPQILIPAARYKTRRDHVVPLTDPMKRILHKMAPFANDPDSLVFPGSLHDRPLSQHRFKALLPAGVSVHGFRTALTVWGVEAGGFTDDLMQRVLGHVVGTEVTRAYQLSDFFEQRKAVHEAWARYLFGA